MGLPTAWPLAPPHPDVHHRAAQRVLNKAPGGNGWWIIPRWAPELRLERPEPFDPPPIEWRGENCVFRFRRIDKADFHRLYPDRA